MKVLYTGYNINQTGKVMRTGSFLPDDAYCLALEAAGHDVDRRPVICGEDLSHYDRILVGTWEISGLASALAYGALYATSWRDRVPVGYTWDDGRASGLPNLASILKRGIDVMFREDFFPGIRRDGSEWAHRHKILMLSTIQSIWDSYPFTLGCVFAWPKVDPLLVVHKKYRDRIQSFTPVDPSAFLPVSSWPTRILPEDKQNQWVLANRFPSQWWVDQFNTPTPLTWPTLGFGYRSEGRPIVKEAEVIKHYSSSWGVFCAPYYHCGSGWWRTRFRQVAEMGSILVCDPREVAADKWDEHPYARHPHTIEKMSIDERVTLVMAQSNFLNNHEWSIDRCVSAINDWLFSLRRTPHVR